MYLPNLREGSEGARKENKRPDEVQPLDLASQNVENERTIIHSRFMLRQQTTERLDSQSGVPPKDRAFQFIEVDSYGKPQSDESKKIVRSNARGHGVSEKPPVVRRAGRRKILSKQVLSQPGTNLGISSGLVHRSTAMGHSFREGLPIRNSQELYQYPYHGSETITREALSLADSNVEHVTDRELTVHDASNTSRALDMDLTPDFDRWQSRDGAPILYMQAKSWPFPYALRGPVPKTSLWIPESPIPAPDVHARRGCLNKTSPPITFITHSTEYYTYKGESINWIRNQLSAYHASSNNRIVTSDAMIGVILCITMWESRESAQHMKGIKQLVDLRGGLHTLGDTFQIKIILSFLTFLSADIYVAIVTNGAPLFQNVRLARPRPPPLPIRGLGEHSVPDSPLYQRDNRRLDQGVLNSYFCLPSIRILQHIADITNAFLSNSTSLPMLLAGDYFILHPEITQPSALFKIIQNTAVMHRAIFSVPPRPLSSPLNYQYVTAVVNLLSSPDDDGTWVRFPGILLWITLVGTVAASNHPERAFFIHFFGKFLSVARWQWWDEITGALQKFFPLRRIGDAVRD